MDNQSFFYDYSVDDFDIHSNSSMLSKHINVRICKNINFISSNSSPQTRDMITSINMLYVFSLFEFLSNKEIIYSYKIKVEIDLKNMETYLDIKYTRYNDDKKYSMQVKFTKNE